MGTGTEKRTGGVCEAQSEGHSWGDNRGCKGPTGRTMSLGQGPEIQEAKVKTPDFIRIQRKNHEKFLKQGKNLT